MFLKFQSNPVYDQPTSPSEDTIANLPSSQDPENADNSTMMEIFTFRCKICIAGDINERNIRMVLGAEDFFVYDLLDSPIEHWSYTKIKSVMLKKNLFEDDAIFLDMGHWYYKSIHIRSPDAQEAVQLISDIFKCLSEPDKEPLLHIGQYRVFDGIQRFKYYEDVDIRIDLSEKSFKCWRIFPNVPGEEDEYKDLLYDFPFKSISKWRTTLQDKLVLTFIDWLGERTIILTVTDAQSIIETINKICNRLRTTQ